MNPFVTAVLPLHNHEDFVQDAVWSVVRQGYRPLQIVVVNDGSTDGSRDRVIEIMKSPKQLGNVFLGQIEYLKIALLDYQTARGPSFARNMGIKYAFPETDIFAFLDSDDVYRPGKIALSVAKLVDNPLAGVVYSDYETLNPKTGYAGREYKEPYSKERLLRECVVNCNSLVKKEVFSKMGLFDVGLRVCEDYDVWLRASDLCMVLHIPEPLVQLRIGERSATSTVAKETWEKCYARVMEKTRQRMGRNPPA